MSYWASYRERWYKCCLYVIFLASSLSSSSSGRTIFTHSFPSQLSHDWLCIALHWIDFVWTLGKHSTQAILPSHFQLGLPNSGPCEKNRKWERSHRINSTPSYGVLELSRRQQRSFLKIFPGKGLFPLICSDWSHAHFQNGYSVQGNKMLKSAQAQYTCPIHETLAQELDYR